MKKSRKKFTIVQKMQILFDNSNMSPCEKYIEWKLGRFCCCWGSNGGNKN